MEPAARLTLQAAIDDMELGLSSLDKALEIFAARDYPEDQFQHLLPLIEGLSAIFQLVSITINGKNVLTPSLTNKGWKFWKKLQITPFENAALSAATFKFQECASNSARFALQSGTAQDISVLKKTESLVMIQSCYRQYTVDLHAVMGSSC